jgi:hypothetical protein
MKFILNRNKVVTSLLGHAIEFKKGEPTHVPKEMWNDVIAVGAVPEHEIEEEVVKQAPVLTGEERKEMIFAAFTVLVEKNEREAFTGNGSPHIRSLADITGFPVDAKERDTLWAEFRQLHANPDA